MMRMSVPPSSRCVAKLCRSVCTVTRLSSSAAAQAERQAACSAAGCSGCSAVAAGEQPVGRPCQPPVAAQDAKQLRRQHDIAVLASLAVLDADHHPAAVDVGELEAGHLGRTQPAA